jgi:UDP-N-acetylglucosamine 2-epimerase
VAFGTRPEAIKMAPVVRELTRSRSLRPIVCLTGQHREMVRQMLDLFELEPDCDLAVMRRNQTLPGLTGRIVRKATTAIERFTPSAVLVQGDTTTSFGTALAAFYAGVPVGHVEAGLRTGDFRNPFPEEMNRSLIGRLASWHYVPTATARANLLREGIAPRCVIKTGNTIVDALQDIVRVLRRRRDFTPAIDPALLRDRRLVLVTGHRRESFGEGIRNICLALREIADRYDDVLLVYPVHLNPSVDGPVREMLGRNPRILLPPPMEYLPFVDLMSRAYLILTDSGGIQEEAPSLRVPVLVMRRTTERPEGVKAGVARLVGTSSARIVREARRLLDNPGARGRMVSGVNPYGDGTAARRIVRHLEKALGRA